MAILKREKCWDAEFQVIKRQTREVVKHEAYPDIQHIHDVIRSSFVSLLLVTLRNHVLSKQIRRRIFRNLLSGNFRVTSQVLAETIVSNSR